MWTKAPRPPGGTSGEAFDVVHARMLRFFPELVEELGGDPAPLMRRVGLSRRGLAAPQSGPGYRQVMEALELAACELRCPDFGMRLARRQSDTMFGPLGRVMRHSRTFGHALDYVVGHAHAHSPAARIWRTEDRPRRATFIGHDILLDAGPGGSQAIEQVLLVGHLAAMDITGGHARARRVLFRHQPLSPAAVYRRHFRCEVGFGARANGIFFSDRDLASPVIASDAQAYRAATDHIAAMADGRRPPLHARVRSMILQHLGTERCTNAHVAGELNLHTRTLHRRLADEGTTFQAIKDEVRRNLMLFYLQRTGTSLARISEKLGFAEQSVMTRACVAWFGASPTQVRLRSGRPEAGDRDPVGYGPHVTGT